MWGRGGGELLFSSHCEKEIENHEPVVNALSLEVWGAIKDLRN